MPSSHLILCHPLLLLPPIPPSIRVFSSESMRWPKYSSFSFSIIPSKEHPGLISFTMDWLDLLAVQGTLKSLLQHHSSKASILLHSAFFTWFKFSWVEMVRFSRYYFLRRHFYLSPSRLLVSPWKTAYSHLCSQAISPPTSQLFVCLLWEETLISSASRLDQLTSNRATIPKVKNNFH